MEQALMFLKSHADLAFATVDSDNKPKLRVFQVMKFGDDSLWFATAPCKEVYAQLLQNRNVEVLAMESNVSVRISGVVAFDVSDEDCREIFNTNPVLSRLYTSYKELVYFRLPMQKMDYFDLSTSPPTHKSLAL